MHEYNYAIQCALPIASSGNQRSISGCCGCRILGQVDVVESHTYGSPVLSVCVNNEALRTARL